MADTAAELEAGLTSGGTLLVWAEKYRHADPDAVSRWRTRLLEIGDHARRLARAGRLDESAARSLLRAVHESTLGLRRLIESVRASADYRAAVAAHGRGDTTALGSLLPRIFAELVASGSRADAYWVPSWQRRGRPLPPAKVAAELGLLRVTGIPASGDDLAPGIDAELPGVVLSLSVPTDVPVWVEFAAHVLPPPSLRLGDDQLLVPIDCLRLPFRVAVADDDAPLD